MAGINTETTDGVVYSVCAGDPYPTIGSSTLPPKVTPKPKPSQAIIIYREDNCKSNLTSLGNVNLFWSKTSPNEKQAAISIAVAPGTCTKSPPDNR